jgi:hypothetical protein
MFFQWIRYTKQSVLGLNLNQKVRKSDPTEKTTHFSIFIQSICFIIKINNFYMIDNSILFQRFFAFHNKQKKRFRFYTTDVLIGETRNRNIETIRSIRIPQTDSIHLQVSDYTTLYSNVVVKETEISLSLFHLLSLFSLWKSFQIIY